MRRNLPLLIALGLLLLTLAITTPAFFSAANLRDLALSNIPVLIAALGMTSIILLGQIDVSIGSQFAICTVAAGLLAKAGLPAPLLVAGSAAAGMAMGACNGALVAWAGIPSIVVTLATMVILRDGLRWTTGGEWVQNLPGNFQWMGLGQSAGQTLIAIAAAVIFAACAWMMRYLAFGRAVYATGSNTESARLAGIKPRRVVFSAFIAMGAFTGVAALLNSIRFSDLQSNSGIGLELKTIAAVVVGGTAINGGRGTVTGTLLGVALLGTIGPALTFLGVSAFWEKAIQGAIILAAVAIDRLARKK